MSVQPTHLILCGGKGTRLRPLTETIPKPLVEIDGKPCLQHILEGLMLRGQRRFILCVGYRGDAVADFVERAALPAEVLFSDAGVDASILERLHAARDLIDERASVTYGDTLIDVDLDQMLAHHRDCGAEITLTTAEVQSPFGLLEIGDGLVRGYREKPVHPYYVGHMMMERATLDDLDADLLAMPDGDGLVTLFQRLIEREKLGAFSYDGPRITFNTPQDLDRAREEAGGFFTQVHEGSA